MKLSELTTIKYPERDPKEWGPHYWYYLHENAALYPQVPTEEEQAKEREHINYVITHLPCKETCEANAVAYVQNNPPDLSSRKAYFAWLVGFHNAINQETGNEERIEDPESLLGQQSCEKCNIPGTTNAGEIQSDDTEREVSHDTDAKFNDSIRKYKESVRDVIRYAYKQKGKEAPEIIFARCPDGQDTSCIIVIDGKRYQFQHPRDLIRSVFHEVDHGIDSMDGKHIDDSLEDKANKYATDMVEKYFPFEEVMIDKKGKISVAHDVIVRESVPIPTAAAASSSVANPSGIVSDVYGQPSSLSNDPNDPRILNDFPHLKQTLMEIKKEELKGEIREFERKGGVLSHFDRIYEAPAGWTGLKPEDLNIIHTPTIMGQIVMTFTGAFLSPLTRTLLCSILGVAMMIIGVGIHSKIPTRDIQLIQALASQLTWGTAIPALNPKNARKIKHDVRRIADNVRTKKFHASDLIETPNQEDVAFKPESFNPSFDSFNAFSSKEDRQRGYGIPIPQGRLVDDIVDAGGGMGTSIRQSGNVIRLPKFSSRSHNRFF